MTFETTVGQVNKFDIGIEGSPSLIFLRGNDIINKHHKPSIGFSGGLFLQYNFTKIFSLRTNVAFERKGSVASWGTVVITDNTGTAIDTTQLNTHTNFDYLTMPILFRASFGKKINFFINAGPFFGYLIKQTTVTKYSNNSNSTVDDTYLDKHFDIGVTFGLGVLIPIKERFAISFETRNNLGLYNVSAVPVTNSGTIKTNSTNFLFGFAYRFGTRTPVIQ